MLGGNIAKSGTPIGVEGAVPNSSSGYGLSTPGAPRVGGTAELAALSGALSGDQQLTDHLGPGLALSSNTLQLALGNGLGFDGSDQAAIPTDAIGSTELATPFLDLGRLVWTPVPVGGNLDLGGTKLTGTASINGGVTGNTELTDLVGSGLQISGNTLEALGGTDLWEDAGDDGLLNPLDSGENGIGVTNVQTDNLTDNGSGDVTRGSKQNLDGNNARLTEDFELDMEPGLDRVEFRDTNNSHSISDVTTGNPGRITLENGNLRIRNDNRIEDSFGDAHLTINGGGPLGVNKTLHLDGSGIQSDGSISVDIDANGDGSGETFSLTKNGGATTLLTVEESGTVDVSDGRLDVTDNIDTELVSNRENFPLDVENADTSDAILVLGLETGYTGEPQIGHNFIQSLSPDGSRGTDCNGTIQGDNSGGVTLETSGADYAEFLPRRNPAAEFGPGEIVGVHDGEISHEPDGAARALPVSRAPNVAGNAPADGDTDGHEPVAFTGQGR